ncbi:MAG: 16S rRNA (cytosine(1402)-N(4))-methyltransferase RsmH [Lachnospiraceae bacterium]|nr:16S rRNA (cytosine(1402)-N(4))-methyltransferase RsmH [Lachnospiraceae bacterium]MCH4027602.1 16S rRNA (cytosine(1402)-N(4))-methyltransferase RsmH [Lachnospiraceae bacterium]MCH4065442.1 16S rRNA (cytosine(1402)-N(4))-methyltransferase RsmH [Lachnospiraceae bacterium]MCH4111482.1 16S rRNA (cytosine(1402)-N(4))-methyltransferase RsmH [Lachnospiraceae bacterium]MCI1353078.1 16S rRNA (cytosine(1402)-N(4))-methyltransferase RsmH [Lachnospiraceae bacterium]
MEYKHESVLINEVIEQLKIRPGGIYADGTLGGGGHSFQIAARLSDGGKLIGIDQDEDAVEAAGRHLSVYKDRCILVHDNYENMVSIVKGLGFDKVNGILLDLGVSSYQLDNAERGFSYNQDAPLDMRMDQTNPLSAKKVVNEWSEEELVRILREYGEERYASNIARNIVREREKKPIERTGQLVTIIRSSIPMKMQERGGNPCKRSFQAIRIAVNRELEVLSDSIDGMIDLLAPGGRFCIITFQSLEDRIVKNAFRKNENPCICPPEFPVCVCGRKSKGTVITKKAIVPSAEEIRHNKRASSAKLRVFEKIAEQENELSRDGK